MRTTFFNRIHIRVWGLLAVIALFLGLSWWNEPLPFVVRAQTATTPSAQSAPPSATALPFPVESASMTNGIVLGSTLLILIVVVSTLVVLRTRNRMLKENGGKKQK